MYYLLKCIGVDIVTLSSHSLSTHLHGTQELVDVDIFRVCHRVEEALRNHDTGPCLAWCYDNRSKLRRMKSTLEFQVRLQDFIELVRLNKRVQAIK